MPTDNERTEPVIEVEFSIRGGGYPFVAASDRADCEFDLTGMMPRSGSHYGEFFAVHGADPDRILDLAGATDAVEGSLLRERDDGGLFEFVVSDHCPAVQLAEHGALPREVSSSGGEGQIVAEIPPERDASSVVAEFLDAIPEADFACKHEKDAISPLLARSTLEHALETVLTDRQREVLQAAFEAGYYDWPREATGEEMAAELDISSATFAQHIHTAERKLLAEVFDPS